MENIYYAMPKRYSTREGKHLFGKVEFRDPITSNLLDAYSYNKDGEYVITKNPQYTDVFGIIPDTFTLNHLTLVCQYSYVGKLSDPSIDDDPNAWVHEYDFFVSFNNEKDEIVGPIYGINDLRDADVAQGSVNVVGYYNKFDCQNRTYVWDENCVQAEDGGYIIKSNNQSKGRWVLVWNQEALPSEIYGVYTGKEANLGNLLTYLDNVGSYSIPTAKVIEFTNFRFASGTNRTLNTDKIVRCSRDCYFGKGNFVVQDVYVDGQYEGADKTLGNFVIRDKNNNTKVCISWYSTADQFYNSNAHHLVYDYDGGKAAQWNTLNNDCWLSNVTLEYLVDTHTTYNANMTLENVNLIMSPSFYWGIETTKRFFMKDMTLDSRNFRKLKVTHCSNCIIKVYNEFEYDAAEDTNNMLYIYEGSKVFTEETTPLDEDWFQLIEDGTINAPLKQHGTATYNHCYLSGNFTNDDFSDVDFIDFSGYTSNFNLSAKTKQTVVMLNANNIKFTISNTNSNPYDFTNITFRNCDNMTMDNLSAINGRKLNLTIDNCLINLESMDFGGDDVRNNIKVLGNNVVIKNGSVINDNRKEMKHWDEESQAYVDTSWDFPETSILNDLKLVDSTYNMNNVGKIIVAKKSRISNVKFISESKNKTIKDAMFSAEITSGGSIDCSNNFFENVSVIHVGTDGKTTSHVIFMGNTFISSVFGWSLAKKDGKLMSDFCNGIAIGNTLLSSGISLNNEATPSHYKIDNNTNLIPTTTAIPKTFYGTGLAGQTTLGSETNSDTKNGINNVWLKDYEIKQTGYSDSYKGRSEEIFKWIKLHYFFYPTKTNDDSYDDLMDKINNGNYGYKVAEHRAQYTGTDVIGKSTNSKYTYTINIVVE